MYDIKNIKTNKTVTSKIECSQFKTKCHCHQSVLKFSKVGFIWRLMQSPHGEEDTVVSLHICPIYPFRGHQRKSSSSLTPSPLHRLPLYTDSFHILSDDILGILYDHPEHSSTSIFPVPPLDMSTPSTFHLLHFISNTSNMCCPSNVPTLEDDVILSLIKKK